jgi:lipopolysaccharide biosynthesis regulator YciM
MIDQLYTILIIAGILIIGYFFLSTLVFRRKGKKEVDPHYTAALEALVRSDEENAKEHLIRSAESNPSSLSPFLVLGDLFRKRGDAQKAVQIHYELSIRPKLSKEDVKKIHKSLTLDYLELDDFKKAEQTAQKLLSLDKRDEFALNSLLQVYEGMHDWKGAVETAKTIAHRFPNKGNRFLSRYHAFIGREFIGSDSRKAESLFKKALSLDPACVSASICLGDLYSREGRFDKAIKLWDEMLEREPKAIHHLVDRLERAYFESGKYSQMIDVYERIHRRIPGDVLVLLGLARLNLKKGDFGSALRYAEEAREVDPEDNRVYRVFLEIQEETGDSKPALEACRDFFTRIAEIEKKYRCPECGCRAESILFRCPACGNWDMEYDY